VLSALKGDRIMRRNEAVRRVREKSGGIENRSVSIPFLAGRPKRDAVISSDDLTNLKIALALCADLEDFLEVT
jgi:hypothetical protein